jgi:hypothetical protein
VNAAHLHLVMVHAPVVAPLFALILLGLAAIRADRGALLGAVVTLLVGALGATGAYISGEDAEELVEDVAPIDEAAVEEHEERAEVALVLAWVAAVGSAVAYVLGGRTGRHGAAVGASALGALAASGAMAATGLAAGPIRHGAELGVTPGAGGGAREHGEAGEDDDD